MKICAICNQKGGVGKTTTTLNLALALKNMGKRVLLCDDDPQGNLSSSVVSEENLRQTQTLSELIHCTVAELPINPELFINKSGEVDIITSNKLLAAANSILGTSSDSGMVIHSALAAVTHDGLDYDFVLLDCAPTLDLLVANALNAASGIIIPTEAANYSVDGILNVIQTVTKLQKTSNPELHIERIVINKFDGRKKNHQEMMADIVDAFGELVYPEPVPYIKEVEISSMDMGNAMQKNSKSKAWPVFKGLAEVLSHE